MATALQASCPNCKLKVTVSDQINDGVIATVTCANCGKKFGLRFPKSGSKTTKSATSKRVVPAPQAVFDDPFANLSGTLPEPMGATNVNWENYQVRREPLIAGKPLAIAIGVTVALISIVAIGIFVSQNATQMDLSSLGKSMFKGPSDSIEKIHSDWVRFEAEQEKLTASITRQSDCDEVLNPIERLQEKQLNLLIRAALLDRETATEFDAKNLPPRPSIRSNEDRTFRSIEGLLTKEFRAAEKKLNQNSKAVLTYLHSAAMPLDDPANEAEKFSLNKTLIKHSLCRILAEAHRGADESKTAVAIYELAEEMKQQKTANEALVVKKDSPLPDEYAYADYAADQMQIALAERFTKDPESDIAKALAALSQAF